MAAAMAVCVARPRARKAMLPVSGRGSWLTGAAGRRRGRQLLLPGHVDQELEGNAAARRRWRPHTRTLSPAVGQGDVGEEEHAAASVGGPETSWAPPPNFRLGLGARTLARLRAHLSPGARAAGSLKPGRPPAGPHPGWLSPPAVPRAQTVGCR